MESERDFFLTEVENMKNKLISDQPRSANTIEDSRIKVNGLIEENHRIIEKLKRA
jgi:hypothetical protein